jgi:broad specificity phosphatase PhoE
MRTTVFLVRHGETDYNIEGRIQGASDFSALTHHGARQAEMLRERLRKEKFNVMYSSPLRRAMETAHMLRPKGLDILTDDGLRERSFGELEGKTWEEVGREKPGLHEEYRATRELPGVGGAESSGEMHKRVWECFRRMVLENPGKRILVVTHGGFIAMVMAMITKTPIESRDRFQNDNCSVTVINYDDEDKAFNAEKFNDTSHLEAEI